MKMKKRNLLPIDSEKSERQETKMKRLLITAAMAALAVGCWAQGFPGDGQGGPPPGGGGFRGPGGPGMRMGPPSAAMLVMRPDVQEDLQLTSDQTKALDDLRQSMRPPGGGPGGFGG